jgi:hypothetical protein
MTHPATMMSRAARKVKRSKLSLGIFPRLGVIPWIPSLSKPCASSHSDYTGPSAGDGCDTKSLSIAGRLPVVVCDGLPACVLEFCRLLRPHSVPMTNISRVQYSFDRESSGRSTSTTAGNGS